MISSVLVAIPAVLVVAGVFLLSWGLLREGADAAVRVWLGRRQHILRSRLPKRQEATGGKGAVPSRAARSWGVVWGIGGGILAAAWHHPILSPWFLLLGLFLAREEVKKRERVRVGREELRELETFVANLRDTFQVGQSVFAALQAAGEMLPPGNLRDVVEETVRLYMGGSSMQAALAPMRESGIPYMRHLAAILEQVGSADEETFRRVIDETIQQIRRSRALQDRARTVLVLTRLTLRVLQVANLAALIAVTAILAWYRFWAAHPAGLVVATGLAVGGSWYFASEIRRMEEML